MSILSAVPRLRLLAGQSFLGRAVAHGLVPEPCVPPVKCHIPSQSVSQFGASVILRGKLAKYCQISSVLKWHRLVSVLSGTMSRAKEVAN